MKKRLLAAIMSLCMIVSLLPVSALAYDGHGGYPGSGHWEDQWPDWSPDDEKYDVYLEFEGDNVPTDDETVTVTINGQHKNGNVQRSGIFVPTYYVLINDLVRGDDQYGLTATVTNNDGYRGTTTVQWDGGWFGDDRYEGTVRNWSKPGEPSHSDTDAYFYVLQPNYSGTLAEADLGDFYYVGVGSVTKDATEEFNVNGIDDLIAGEPAANADAFTALGLDGEAVYNYVGQNFGNVTWYRTVKATVQSRPTVLTETGMIPLSIVAQVVGMWTARSSRLIPFMKSSLS